MSGCEACCGDVRRPVVEMSGNMAQAKPKPTILPSPYPKFPDDGCSACCADRPLPKIVKPTKFDNVKAAIQSLGSSAPTTPAVPAPTPAKTKEAEPKPNFKLGAKITVSRVVVPGALPVETERRTEDKAAKIKVVGESKDYNAVKDKSVEERMIKEEKGKTSVRALAKVDDERQEAKGVGVQVEAAAEVWVDIDLSEASPFKPAGVERKIATVAVTSQQLSLALPGLKKTVTFKSGDELVQVKEIENQATRDALLLEAPGAKLKPVTEETVSPPKVERIREHPDPAIAVKAKPTKEETVEKAQQVNVVTSPSATMPPMIPTGVFFKFGAAANPSQSLARGKAQLVVPAKSAPVVSKLVPSRPFTLVATIGASKPAPCPPTPPEAEVCKLVPAAAELFPAPALEAKPAAVLKTTPPPKALPVAPATQPAPVEVNAEAKVLAKASSPASEVEKTVLAVKPKAEVDTLSSVPVRAPATVAPTLAQAFAQAVTPAVVEAPRFEPVTPPFPSKALDANTVEASEVKVEVEAKPSPVVETASPPRLSISTVTAPWADAPNSSTAVRWIDLLHAEEQSERKAGLLASNASPAVKAEPSPIVDRLGPPALAESEGSMTELPAGRWLGEVNMTATPTLDAAVAETATAVVEVEVVEVVKAAKAAVKEKRAEPVVKGVAEMPAPAISAEAKTQVEAIVEEKKPALTVKAGEENSQCFIERAGAITEKIEKSKEKSKPKLGVHPEPMSAWPAVDVPALVLPPVPFPVSVSRAPAPSPIPLRSADTQATEAPPKPVPTRATFEFGTDTPLPSSPSSPTFRPVSPTVQNDVTLPPVSSLPTSPLTSSYGPRAAADRAPWPSHAATRMHLPSHAVREVRPGSPRDPVPQSPPPSVRRTATTTLAHGGLAPALTPGSTRALGVSSRSPSTVAAVLPDAAVHNVTPATASALAAPVEYGRDAVHVEAVTPSLRLGSPFGTPLPKIANLPSPPLDALSSPQEEKVEVLLAPPMLLNIEPGSPTDVANLGGSSGLDGEGDPILDALASTRSPAPIGALLAAYEDDTAALGACEAEIKALKGKMADAEQVQAAKRTRVLAYQVALDEELAALDAERSGLLKIREAIFADTIKDKNAARDQANASPLAPTSLLQ